MSDNKKWPQCQTTAPEHVYLLLDSDDRTDDDYQLLAADAPADTGVMWSSQRDMETVAQYTRTDIAEARIAELESAVKRAVLAYERLGHAKAPLPRQDDIREIEDSMIALKNLVINHD